MGGFAIGCLLPSDVFFHFDIPKPSQFLYVLEGTKTKPWILHGLPWIWGRWLRQRNVSSMTRGWCCSVVPRLVKSENSCVQFFSGIEGQHLKTSNSFGASPFSEWQLWNPLMLSYETDFTIGLMMNWWMTLPDTSSLVGLEIYQADRPNPYPPPTEEWTIRSQTRMYINTANNTHMYIL